MGIEIYYDGEETSGDISKAASRHVLLLGELSVRPKGTSSSLPDEPGGRGISGPLLKRFLCSCESSHGTFCNNASRQTSDRKSVTLLLVDVEKHCLVSFDTNLECHYVALSYVWGGVLMLHTTRENLFTLMQQNSLKRLENQLPKVARDAMAVVSMMGERYLWTDNLCIVQDDPAWKHLQISQMDLIYSHAILTIVALSGTNANEGLPGVAPDFRFPTAAHLQGVTITSLHLISKTLWQTQRMRQEGGPCKKRLYLDDVFSSHTNKSSSAAMPVSTSRMTKSLRSK